MDSLSKIGSMLGILIKTDKPTKEKIALSYARLLIKMPVNGLFPDSIDFISEGDGVIRQFVKYEWKPKKCIHCLMLGHEEQNCRKKYTVRQEWRVKQQPSVPIQAVEQHQMDVGGRQRGRIPVHQGYKWYAPSQEKYGFTKLVWFNLNIPRHTFTAWVLMRQKLPVNSRLTTYLEIEATCP
ncbi:hypothetical protein Cgig2_015291 [Carnegiea gigantea]|uniref:Reverse transcriptase zinc-binding domain-containing protein n=1 Tax=Carnegiea gigantea TaxID=171969 RepID=A0A9Q1K7K9_9CARY|nr:hypothetical protein Cgig2_015291 [Carnegiea gigantea]